MKIIFHLVEILLGVIFLIDSLEAAAPANSVSIQDFGATPNDDTDDTAAILKTITNAASNQKTVYIPSGRFLYSSVLLLDGISMSGEGDTSILEAIDPNNMAINLYGNRPSLEKVVIISTRGQQKRTSRLNSVGVLIGRNDTQTKDFLLKSVQVFYVDSVGIFTLNSGPGKIISNFVNSSLADCIHTTDEAHDIIIANNLVTNCGDDMYATVAYRVKGNPPRSMRPVRNILIQNNTGIGGIGRGLSAVGSQDISFIRNRIRGTRFAGVLVASEVKYDTYGPKNILVQENEFQEVGHDGGHSGMLLSATFGQSDRVTFIRNSVTNTPNDAVRISGITRNTTVVDNRFFRVKGFSIRFTQTNDSMEVYVAGNSRDGVALKPSAASGANLKYN